MKISIHDVRAAASEQLDAAIERSGRSIPRLTLMRDQIPSEARPVYEAENSVVADFQTGRVCSYRKPNFENSVNVPLHNVLKTFPVLRSAQANIIPINLKEQKLILEKTISEENRLFAKMLRKASDLFGHVQPSLQEAMEQLNKLNLTMSFLVCHEDSLNAIEKLDGFTSWIQGDKTHMCVKESTVLTCPDFPKGSIFVLPPTDHLGVFPAKVLKWGGAFGNSESRAEQGAFRGMVITLPEHAVEAKSNGKAKP